MSLFLAFGITLMSFRRSRRKAPNKGHKVDLDLMGYNRDVEKKAGSMAPFWRNTEGLQRG